MKAAQHSHAHARRANSGAGEVRAFALCSGARWIERQHGRTGGASIVSACVGCAVGDIVKVHHKARCFGCTEHGKARQCNAI